MIINNMWEKGNFIGNLQLACKYGHGQALYSWNGLKLQQCYLYVIYTILHIQKWSDSMKYIPAICQSPLPIDLTDCDRLKKWEWKRFLAVMMTRRNAKAMSYNKMKIINTCTALYVLCGIVKILTIWLTLSNESCDLTVPFCSSWVRRHLCIWPGKFILSTSNSLKNT